jgi:hypothetical protein
MDFPSKKPSIWGTSNLGNPWIWPKIPDPFLDANSLHDSEEPDHDFSSPGTPLQLLRPFLDRFGEVVAICWSHLVTDITDSG